MKKVIAFIIGGLLFVAGYDCIRRQAKLTSTQSIQWSTDTPPPIKETVAVFPETTTDFASPSENQLVSN